MSHRTAAFADRDFASLVWRMVWMAFAAGSVVSVIAAAFVLLIAIAAG